MNTKRVGLFGLMAVAMAGLFTPTVASAHERCERRYYAPAPVFFHDRDWREMERREAREREIIRHREWRESRYGYRGYR
jgi:hypothetical protein